MKVRTLSIWLTSICFLTSFPFLFLSYYSSRASSQLDMVIAQNGLHSVSADTIRAWIQAQKDLWEANCIFALLSGVALGLNLVILIKKAPFERR